MVARSGFGYLNLLHTIHYGMVAPCRVAIGCGVKKLSVLVRVQMPAIA